MKRGVLMSDIKPVTRKLLSQGDRDGACFLYAIANAFTCLTNTQPGQADWDRVIDIFPEKNRADFLKGNIGTGILFDEFEKGAFDLQNLIQRVLECFSASVVKNVYKIKYFEDITKKSDVGNLIDQKSVVLFCYLNEHWVVGTAYDPDTKPPMLYVACSAQVNDEGNCIETCDPILNRPCNAFITQAGLGSKYTVFQITRLPSNIG